MLSGSTAPIHINHVGMLNEIHQRVPGTNIQDTYTFVGMDHARIWTCTLSLVYHGSVRIFVASGCTKKESKDRCGGISVFVSSLWNLAR